MELDEFYEFMIEDYFQWKYTDSRWLKRNRGHFSRYVSEERLDELSKIKEQLFSFNLNDIEKGLRITSSINGLGVAGGSGLLALLFPAYFGTVDQFVVESLILVDEYKDNINLIKMKDKTISDNRQEDVVKLKDTLSIKKDYKIDLNNKTDLVNLKNNFEIYLRNKGRKEARIKEDLSWAFVHYNNDIGIDFWESFKNDEKIKECQDALYKLAANGGLTGRGVKDPKGYAAGYISSIKRLKDFFDEEYGSVDKYMRLHGGL